MNFQQFFIAIANPFVGAILRSPLHGLISASTLLITVHGRKSGQPITTPVNYVRDGRDLLIISQTGRTWWRNLRGGNHDVTCLLHGRTVKGTAAASEDSAAVAQGLAVMAAASPPYASYLGITFAEDGHPAPDSLRRAAAGRVLVRVRPD